MATSYTWLGTVNGNLSSSLNYSPTGNPTSADSCVFDNTSVGYVNDPASGTCNAGTISIYCEIDSACTFNCLTCLLISGTTFDDTATIAGDVSIQTDGAIVGLQGVTFTGRVRMGDAGSGFGQWLNASSGASPMIAAAMDGGLAA